MGKLCIAWNTCVPLLGCLATNLEAIHSFFMFNPKSNFIMKTPNTQNQNVTSISPLQEFIEEMYGGDANQLREDLQTTFRHIAEQSNDSVELLTVQKRLMPIGKLIELLPQMV